MAPPPAAPSNRSRDPVSLYLSAHAEPGAAAIADAIADAGHRFEDVLVIPAFREPADFFRRLAATLFAARPRLLILVINQPDTQPETDADNSALWRAVRIATTAVATPALGVGCELRGIGAGAAVLLIDRFRCGARLPQREGVGRARKIGADIALALIARGAIGSRWIHNSDADAHLPAEYFATPAVPAAVAQVLRFRHRCAADTIGCATRLYQLGLDYHVAGLRWAGSPYAFHSIGSALIVRADAYAKVRGFPRRAGGEDFYLLNKLAKIGAVVSPPAPVIEIDARTSTRVPFGTGPAVARLVQRLEAGVDPATLALFLHPDAFRQLRACLAGWPPLYRGQAPDLDPRTRDALRALGLEHILRHARRHSRDERQFERQMNTWFDGFRTVKLLHALRECGWPQVDLATARTAPFFPPLE